MIGIVLALAATISAPPVRTDIVIADFEGSTYGEWATIGSAFGTGPARGTLPNQRPVSGYQGQGLANSFLGGDSATGTLISPPFTIQRRYINFLIGGGLHIGVTCMDLMLDGTVVRTATGRSQTFADAEDLKWATWDVSKLQGRAARIRIIDASKWGWGHILVDQIVQSDTRKEKPIVPDKLYSETYRPQFHFSPKQNWLNDPNGLVFYKGTWHLFYQYCPDLRGDGEKYWGYATSRDLVHWQEHDLAIAPDEYGAIWSGGAAVDWTNASGLGKNGKPPIVAFYTAAGKTFTQRLVVSDNEGQSWRAHGAPVLGHIVGSNRDPRPVYFAPTKTWVLAVYLDGDEFGLFGSKDMKQWKELSRLRVPGSSECPELFEMPIEGKAGQTKWVFFGGNYRYLIGSFDGRVFTPEVGPIQSDFGNAFYASQTWSDAPNGRRVQIAWMPRGDPMPGMGFTGQMSFPCDLRLQETAKGLRILRWPAKEIERLWAGESEWKGLELKGTEVLSKVPQSDLLDISAELDFGSAQEVGLTVRGQRISVSRGNHMLHCLGQEAPLDSSDDHLRLRILVDRSSIEVFGDDGQVSMTSYLPTEARGQSLEAFATAGVARVVELTVHSLHSTWK